MADFASYCCLPMSLPCQVLIHVITAKDEASRAQSPAVVSMSTYSMALNRFTATEIHAPLRNDSSFQINIQNLWRLDSPLFLERAQELDAIHGHDRPTLLETISHDCSVLLAWLALKRKLDHEGQQLSFFGSNAADKQAVSLYKFQTTTWPYGVAISSQPHMTSEPCSRHWGLASLGLWNMTRCWSPSRVQEEVPFLSKFLVREEWT